MVEQPVVRARAEDVARHIEQHPAKFGLLRGGANLAAAHVADATQPFILEVETNSFMFSGKCVVFHVFSMLNHACATSNEENVCFSILNTGDKTIDDGLEVKLVATKDISAGEPLHISYHQVFAEPVEKEERIKAHCGGNCRCSLCRARGSVLDLEQLGREFPGRGVCQHCRSGNREAKTGDLVALLSGAGAAYFGLHGRVLESRASDGRLLVRLQFQGREERLWLAASHFRSLGVDASLPGLRQCGRCKTVAFCSEQCQRAGWKAHKAFCGEKPRCSWKDEYRELQLLRARFDGPEARQAANASDLTSAFDSARRFVQVWTQPGRAPHLAAGHQAVQQALLLAIPLGTLALWRQLAEGVADRVLWSSVGELVRLHLQTVRALVPRFHIALWTALHHVRGLLSLRELMPESSGADGSSVGDLVREFARHLDVAEVYDPDAAASFRQQAAGGPDGGLSSDGSKLFVEMAKDPARLAEFYKIDPEAPLEKKMELMSRLLTSKAAASSRPATQHRHHQQQLQQPAARPPPPPPLSPQQRQPPRQELPDRRQPPAAARRTLQQPLIEVATPPVEHEPPVALNELD